LIVASSYPMWSGWVMPNSEIHRESTYRARQRRIAFSADNWIFRVPTRPALVGAFAGVRAVQGGETLRFIVRFNAI